MDEVLQLDKREKELQNDICELEWPADAGEQFTIMKLIANFMEETETGQRRTGAIIGWPQTTLNGRLQRFRRSQAERLAAPDHKPWGEAPLARAQRMAKADPEAFLEDPATARKIAAAIAESPTGRRIVADAMEAEPLPPTTGRARATVEDQNPGERLLLEFYAWYVRGKPLISLARDSGRLNKAGREDLEETAERVKSLVDLVVTAGTSGDWDEELEGLLREEMNG